MEQPFDLIFASPLRSAVRGVDARLRRHDHVRIFSAAPDCVLRISIDHARCGVTLGDGACIAEGEEVVGLHFWNERLAEVHGRGVAWAAPMSRKVVSSLRELARALRRDPDLAEAGAVKAEMATARRHDRAWMRRFASRFGFEPVSEPPSPIERAEDLWLLALAWTFRPQTLGGRDLVRRHESVWISRAAFLARFGDDA